MKNLFRIYLNELRPVIKLFVVVLVLTRIGVFSIHAVLEDGSTAFFGRAIWNVHGPVVLGMLVMQTFFMIYQRKELTLLPESNWRKCGSMVVFIGLQYVAMYCVLIGCDLLLNAFLAICQPAKLYSPLVSVQSLAYFFATMPVDCLYLLLLITLFNVMMPLLVNQLLLFFACNIAALIWIILSWMQKAANGELDRGLVAADPPMAVLLVAGIAACLLVGQYCFNRRAVCDHKLLNL